MLNYINMIEGESPAVIKGPERVLQEGQGHHRVSISRPVLTGFKPTIPVEVTPNIERTNTNEKQIQVDSFFMDSKRLRESGVPEEEIKSKLASHINAFTSFHN